MDQRMKDALDRHITGNYGEDQFRYKSDPPYFFTRIRNSEKIVGASFKGAVDASFDELVSIFGDPDDGDGEKTDAEWDIEFSDGMITTIYNYCDGRAYAGPYAPPVEDLRDWHIGAFKKEAVGRIEELLDYFSEGR